MTYRSSEKTRQKKDAKRTAMMQAAVRIFAEKGYQAATIRDIVNAADVAIGTFYFYFPDKETLFIHLYEETGDFLAQTLQQAINSRSSYPQKIRAALQSFVSIATYEPSAIQLLLVSGAGGIPALASKHSAFQEKLIRIWQRPLSEAIDKNLASPQNDRRTAEALTGALNQVILSLIAHPDANEEAPVVVEDLTRFVMRASAYYEQNPASE
ncbi:MAG: TetR/AcrR family transcriptional regulator [Candidatus Promineifilaceae bacterium]|nr:TetR/AcrR family transcriptional regulator [Candidatus Promineifilaceae bacterium]